MHTKHFFQWLLILASCQKSHCVALHKDNYFFLCLLKTWWASIKSFGFYPCKWAFKKCCVFLMCWCLPASLMWDSSVKAAKHKAVESKTISTGTLEFLNNLSKPHLPIFMVTSRCSFLLFFGQYFSPTALSKKSSLCSSEPNRAKKAGGQVILINFYDDQSLEVWV